MPPLILKGASPYTITALAVLVWVMVPVLFLVIGNLYTQKFEFPKIDS